MIPFIILIAILRSFFRIYVDLFKLPEFRGLMVVSAIYIALGAVGFRILEGWSWLDAIYFGVVSLATVGYGDVTPKTEAGKIFDMIYLIAGVGLLSGLIAIVGDGTRRTMALEHERRMKAEEALKGHMHGRHGKHRNVGAEEAAAAPAPAEPPSDPIASGE